jgi:hypothetical protein
MKASRLASLSIALVTFGALVAPVTAAASQNSSAPRVELVAAQNQITISSTGGPVYIDPGIWVASVGASLEFRVWRGSYTRPIRIAQVLNAGSGRTRLRGLPRTLLPAVPIGLRDFIDLTVRDAAGAIVASAPVVFCPNSAGPEKLTPDAPASSPFPPLCAADPFPLSQVWGIERDWAVDPLQSYQVPVQLSPGTYRVTEKITRAYSRLFNIPPADAAKTVKVIVTGPANRPDRSGPSPARPGYASSHPLPSGSHVPDLTKPPISARPDLVALPAWGIGTSHAQSGPDLLNFGATVWIGGNGPLDIEGFRVPSSPVMKAYQYFWRDGRLIGRVGVGTMGFFDYNHWHFEQFARYTLLDSDKRIAVRSHKVGFCIAPSDPVDLLAPHAVWRPSSVGLAGRCGSPTALWVREMLPVGWGDTYIQYLVGQSFDITKVPDGTYYIEIVANPLGVIRETTRADDISLRKVILGGKPGNRTVSVPSWHGIDPEG